MPVINNPNGVAKKARFSIFQIAMNAIILSTNRLWLYLNPKTLCHTRINIDQSLSPSAVTALKARNTDFTSPSRNFKILGIFAETLVRKISICFVRTGRNF